MTPTSDNRPPTPSSHRRSLPARGGRRPGAGAKPGNLNALKHGRRSAQFAHLGLILATIPETRQALLALAARHRLKQRKAEHVAARLLNAMIERARRIAERRTINQNEEENPASQIRPAASKFVNPAKPSNPRHNRQRTIKNQTRSSP